MQFYLGVVALLFIALIYAGMLVYTNKVKAKVNSSLLNLTLGPPLIMLSGFIAFGIEGSEVDYKWDGILMIGVAAILLFGGITLLYFACKYEKPSICSVIGYTQVLFTYIAEILFFDLRLGLYDVIGGALIFSSAIGITIYKLFQK